MNPMRIVVLCVLALAISSVATAAEQETAGPGSAYAKNLDFVGGRVVDLVGAIPEEDFGWSPMEGVRTVSQAAMHMAGANYYFASQLGTPVPEGVDPRGLEEITDKEKVVATLEASIEHLGKAFEGVTDAHAEMQVFGNPGTVEDMMQAAIGHVHEHFGQLIAYARSNGVVPPWSQQQGD